MTSSMISRLLGAVSVVVLVLLLAWDASPHAFPRGAHDFLGAVPLALIGLICVLPRGGPRPTPSERARALLVSAAFLFWAANQYWPDHPLATLFNDIAVALFVIDVLLTVRAAPAPAERTLAEPPVA
jgi:hypothetical protein